MPNTRSRIMEIEDQPDEGTLPEPLPSSDADIPPEDAVLHLDQYSEYLLHSPREILAVLRQVVAQGDLVTIYFNSGKDSAPLGHHARRGIATAVGERGGSTLLVRRRHRVAP